MGCTFSPMRSLTLTCTVHPSSITEDEPVLAFAAATQDHGLWSCRTQFHSRLGNWLQQADYNQTWARRWLTACLPQQTLGGAHLAGELTVNPGGCVIPLAGEASLWTSAVTARPLLHGRVLRRARQQSGSQGALQHHCILLLAEGKTLFSPLVELLFS